jgi:hypothetical protein
MAETKKVFLYVGIGCVVLGLLAACGVGACVFALKTMTDEPATYAKGFLDDTREGNFAQALTRMNASYQNTHSVATFQQAAEALPALTNHTATSFTNRSIANTSATVGGSLTTPDGSIPFQVTLTKIGEHWYIDAVSVNDQNML